MKKISLVLLLVVSALSLNAAFVTGKYIGNGGATKAITGLGFRPEVVLVKANGWQNSWISTSTMSAGFAKDLTTSSAPIAGYISSLDNDGFTVGNSQHSNAAGTTYYYVAWDDANGDISIGSFKPNSCNAAWVSNGEYYTGQVVSYNGFNYKAIGWTPAGFQPNTNPLKWTNLGACAAFDVNVNVGYRPEMVWVIGEGIGWDQTSPAQFVFDGPNSNKPAHFNQGSYVANEEKIIADLSSNGFAVRPVVNSGTHNGTANGVKYNYVCFKPSSKVETNTYSGNQVNNRLINTISGKFIMEKNTNNTQNTWFKTDAMGIDSSFKFLGAASAINIKTINSSGFTIGHGGETNDPGTYEYFVMGASCPTVNINVTPSSASIIEGASVQLTVSGANTYTWSPSTSLSISGASVTANPNTTTTYTVIGTDANGCSGTASVTVTVNQVTIPATNTNITAEIIGSCPGDSTGSITLAGLDTIYSGPLSLADCNTGTLVTGTNIIVNEGEVKRLSTSVANAHITINGGKLIVCSSLSIESLIINGGSLINNGAIVINSSVIIPEEGAIFNNNGSMAFYGAVSVEGLLFNIYGSTTVYSSLTINGDGQILNNSTFTDAVHNTSLPINFYESSARKESIIKWDGTNQTGTKAKGLKAGTYTAKIYLGSSITTKAFTVPVVTPPQVNATATNNTDSVICNGSITTSVTGGLSPYFYLWSTLDSVITGGQEINGLCAGTYNLSVFDATGCTSDNKTISIIDDIEIPVDTNEVDDNDTTVFHEDVTPAPIDTVASLLKASGMNAVWNLTSVDFNKYISEALDDSSMYSQIPIASILRDYPTSFGDSVFTQSPQLNFGTDSLKITRQGTYTIKTDATGTLVIGNLTYSDLKRVCVREKYYFFCSVGCDELGKDTVFVFIDSYYWFASDTATVPILTFREKTNVFDSELHLFYQEIIQSPNNNNINIEDFRTLVNLQATPNPAVGNSVVISYFLPEDAPITLSLSNSLTGFNAVLQNTNQVAGIHSVDCNIDSYLTGTYTLTIIVGGIPVSTNLIINH